MLTGYTYPTGLRPFLNPSVGFINECKCIPYLEHCSHTFSGAEESSVAEGEVDKAITRAAERRSGLLVLRPE